MNSEERKTEKENTETEVVADLEVSSEHAEEVQAGLSHTNTFTFTITNTSA